jgi:hypothetical protein
MREVVLIQGRSAGALTEVVARADRVLAARTPAGRTQKFVDLEGRVALLQRERADAPDSVELHQQGREGFGFSGFVDLPEPTAAAVRALMDVEAAAVRLRSSPGGVAAFFLADGARARVIAWSSLAGVEGVFYTVGPRAVVVARSPLLSHLIGFERERPEPSLTWAGRILLGNATLWDDTPFAGTFYSRPRSTLVVDDRGVMHVDHPLALAAERFADGDETAVEALARCSLDAMGPARRWPAAELQLSGGKDSRYVAALAVRAGVGVDCVTFAHEKSGEAVAAARVAGFLGLPHRSVRLQVATGDALLAAMQAGIRRADGLINENRQLAYVRPDGGAGRPLLQGQAHHPRGGLHSEGERRRGPHLRRLRRQLLGDVALLDRALVRERRARIVELARGYRVDHALDLPYWIYADWRMSRWLQPSAQATTRERPLLWPMMDERVLALCARLSPRDRASERTFFGALEQLAPGLGAIPLHDDTWKFDRAGAERSPFPEGFAARTTPITDLEPLPRTAERRLSTILPLFRSLMTDLPCAADLRPLFRRGVLAQLLDGETAAARLGFGGQALVRFLWKAVAVALVMDGGWFAHQQP